MPAPPVVQAGRHELRPPIVARLGLWWILAVGLLVAMAWIATDHMWRATGSLSAALLVAAFLRLSQEPGRAGGLVVRRRSIDVAILVLLAVAVAAVGFTLDLSPRL